MTIAGHSFRYGYCECGRKWTDIRYADQQSVGQPNIEHEAGAVLSLSGLEEIRAEVLAEDVRIAHANSAAVSP